MDVRHRVKATLADPLTGFNPNLLRFAEYCGLNPYQIDFAPGSSTFYEAQMAPQYLEDNGLIGGNCMLLFSGRFDDQNLQKFELMSGPVAVGIDVHIYHQSIKVVSDMESLADITSAAIVTAMNNPLINWGYEVVWNGGISGIRQPATPTTLRQSWRQTLRYLLKFEVHEQ
jgi:hypothetical protein